MPKKKTRADGYIERKRTIDGKVYHFYGKTEREVNEKIRKALLKSADKKEQGERFADVAKAFWKWKEPSIKYGSKRGYKHCVDQAISWFGDFGIRAISAADINRELSHMANQGKAYKTIAKQKSVLSMIWRYWCSEMGGDQNPVVLIRLPQGLPQQKRRPPTEEEVALVKAHPEGFGLCPAFMIYAGLRLSEVMALQKEDICDGVIKITKEVVWHGNHPEIDTPKTKNSIRSIPVLQPLQKILEGRLKELKPNSYLFGMNYPLTKSAYENHWLQYCRRIGCIYDTGKRVKTGKLDKNERPLYKSVYAPTFTAHQLRHEFASVLVECHVPETVAKDLMGHADIITTKRWYADAKKHEIENAKIALNDYFNSAK